MLTIVLLTVSNIFMTLAWYGHLKFKSTPLLIAIVASWLIAFAEYCFQVPANRIGAERFSVTQLKLMQECISLTVFLVFAAVAFRETPKWNTVVAMLLILAAVYFAFLGGHGKH
ncbi:MAG TPA: DMT family protein [Abditibacteriaceae bacterium]|jgi:hypothetical protein